MHSRRKFDDVDRGSHVGAVPVDPELTRSIRPPAGDVAVRELRAAMRGAEGDRGCRRTTWKGDGPGRHDDVSVTGPVAELAERVVAPARHRTAVEHGTGVAGRRRHTEGGVRAEIDGSRRRLGGSRCVVAELPDEVCALACQRATVQPCAGVCGAGRNLQRSGPVGQSKAGGEAVGGVERGEVILL